MFVDNQIWSEIAEEIKKHELTEAAFDTAAFTAEKTQELKAFTIKELKKQRVVLEKKIAELKIMANDKFEELKMKLEKLRQMGKFANYPNKDNGGADWEAGSIAGDTPERPQPRPAPPCVPPGARAFWGPRAPPPRLGSSAPKTA